MHAKSTWDAQPAARLSLNHLQALDLDLDLEEPALPLPAPQASAIPHLELLPQRLKDSLPAQALGLPLQQLRLSPGPACLELHPSIPLRVCTPVMSRPA